jgi:uncharacterized SAM-binding protein YcdF (DUF218 family)
VSLKPVLLALLIPPTSLLAPAILGLLLWRARPRLARGLVWGALIGLVILSLPLAPSILLAGLERDLPTTPPEADPPAAIVVLAGETIRSPTAPDGADVGPLTLERLRVAAALHRRTDLPILTSGGTTQPDLPPLSTVMARSLSQDFQVPVRWTETTSRDTWENAQRSAEILRGQGVHSVYVVTHAWHMRRALMAFAATGLVATAAPTPPSGPLSPIPVDFVPRAAAWEQAYYAFHEWIGCAWYALR